ncbi:MAG: hypothetical protein GC178_05330 [Flavobacteriales bacterium]|nr:hypothetical protein [Flavobacteriales bacterium]
MKLLNLLFLLFLTAVTSAQSTFKIKRIEGSGNMGRTLDFVSGVHDSLFQTTGDRVFQPTYDFNKGPVRVEIIDPSVVPNAEMFISLDGVADSCGWKMYVAGGNDTVYSNTTIGVGAEQIISQWGLLVQVKQVEGWNEECDYMLDCSLEFSGTPWLGFLSDSGTSLQYSNWIWPPSSGLVDYDADTASCLERILDGTWAPWRLASDADSVASPSWNKFKSLNKLDNLSSVDVVITSDQNKWTRCPVLEIADSYLPSVGNTDRFNLRMSPSVGKDGLPDGSGTMGMSWFPGYAVNLETGERLNMAFGENSWLQADNGADMVWNPTSTVGTPTGDPILGGGHYIYVFGHNGDSPNDDVPLYDEGSFIYSKLSENGFNPGDPAKRRVYKDAMWVAIPLLEDGHNLLESDVVIKLRVRKPFVDYRCLDTIQNLTHPLYSFNTSDIGTGVSKDFGTTQITFKAYPVPAKDQLTVEVGFPTNERFDLVLRSVDGKEIMRKTFVQQTLRTTLPTVGLSRGLYVLSVEGTTFRKQLKIPLVE